MNHTKEPWDFLGERAPQIIGEDKVIALMYSENMLFGKDKRLLENAKRIVACVNECAGITDAVIEAGIIKKALIAYLGSYDKGMTWNNMKVWEDV